MKIKLDEFEQSVLLLPFCGWFIFIGYRIINTLFSILTKETNGDPQ